MFAVEGGRRLVESPASRSCAWRGVPLREGKARTAIWSFRDTVEAFLHLSPQGGLHELTQPLWDWVTATSGGDRRASIADT